MIHRTLPLVLCVLVAGCTAKHGVTHSDAAHTASQETPLYLVPESNGVGLCQSPINIMSWDAPQSATHGLRFDYKASKQAILNTGHTVKLTYDAGSTVVADGQVYDLVQFHFHTPSEHLIDGVTYPLEMHLVHTLRGEPETYLVVGVLFAEAAEPNAFLAEFLDAVPAEAGAELVRSETVDVRDLQKPGWRAFFSYGGSLTTPPYTESVRWEVLKAVQGASAQQLEKLQALEGNNARHVQSLEGRAVETWTARTPS